MKQVVQNLKTGALQVAHVPPPQLRPGGALVVTRASLISAGTERSKVELGEKSLIGKARARPDLARQVVRKVREDGLLETYQTVKQRLEAPGALGYSACGEIVEVAPDCAGLNPGDLVACAGAGYANHAEVNFVPKHLLARVPAGVAPAQAAYATLGAIALQGVRQADTRVGDRVVVIGLGLVGLLVVQLARAAGARVFGIDVDQHACSLAERLGAERTAARSDRVAAVTDAFTDGEGFDQVVICASTPSDDPVELAAELARDRGRVVVVGAVGMKIPREPYYRKELEVRLSRSYGPGRYDAKYEEHGHDYPIGYVRWTEQRNIAEFLRLLRDGLVDVDSLTTHRFPVDRAAEAYSLISGSTVPAERPVGIVLEYPGADDAVGAARIELGAPAPATARRERVGIGFVGAGNFATRVLLPALKGDERVELVGLATATGVSARHVGERYGFRYATSEAEELMADQDIDAVMIATRHDSHARLAAAALSAGKAVFCEKPLATTWEGLEEVAAAFGERPGPLLVGFNRRFSPFTEAVRSALPAGIPRSFVCRVNAGELAADHWTGDPVAGGGRIVGELCHFLDLACAFALGRPLRVSAEALGTSDALALGDSVVVNVAFECGSVASIQYLAAGDPAVAKERIEVFCGGVVGVIDDFRRADVFADGRRTKQRSRRQEKGHREEMRAFLDLASGSEARVPSAEDAFWSSALTLQVIASLGTGGPATVALPAALGGRGAGAGRTPE